MTSKPTTAKLVLKITSFILRMLLNIIFYVIVIMLITSASKKAYEFCYQVFGQVTASEKPGRDVKVKINKGESTLNVAKKLELNKVIRNKYSFYIKAKLKKYIIMPGTFVVNTSMTYDEIFAIITAPPAEDTKGADDLKGGTNTSEDSSKHTDKSGTSDKANLTETSGDSATAESGE